MCMIDLSYYAIAYFIKWRKNLRVQGFNMSVKVFPRISGEDKQGVKDIKKALTVICITDSQETLTPLSLQLCLLKIYQFDLY